MFSVMATYHAVTTACNNTVFCSSGWRASALMLRMGTQNPQIHVPV